MAVLTGCYISMGWPTQPTRSSPYPAAASVPGRTRSRSGRGRGAVLVLANEVAALAGLASSGGGWIAGATLVVAATVARTLPVLAVQLAPGRVPPDGFGGWFARRVGQVDGVVALVLAASITAVVALAAGSVAVAIGGAVGAIAGLAIAGAIVSLRGQLDGDGLGAIVELTLAPHPSCRRARA